MKLRELFEKTDNDKLVLPDFQRDFEWDADKVARLISSFLVKLPIGSFLILEGHRDDFRSRRLCFPYQSFQPKEECLYLLDGQQRLSALKVAFCDLYQPRENWLSRWDHTYSALRARWFIRVKPKDEDEDDIFGWKVLRFPEFSLWEPQKVFNYIQRYKIYKTKDHDQWYHPAYSPKDQMGNEYPEPRLELDIARHATKDNCLLPLYSIYNASKSKKPLHERVLDQIAQQRVDELKAYCQSGDLDIVEVLKDIEPDISSLVETKMADEIQKAWLKLSTKWVSDICNYLDQLLDQEIYAISLESREISRAISIFENINQGGTPLGVYDLVVARAARDQSQKSLTERILDILKQPISLPDSLKDTLLGGNALPTIWDPQNIGCIEDNKPISIVKDQYLNLLSILSHVGSNSDAIKGEHIRKNKILELDYQQINDNTEKVMIALVRAFSFLQFRCGVIKLKSIPYELMILPLAYYLLDDNNWQNKSIIAKLEYWYWTSIFGGAYRSAQNDRTIRDLRSIMSWLESGASFLDSVHSEILNYQGYSSLDVLLLKDPDNKVTGSLHRALLQYLLSQQPLDFLPGVNLRLNSWDVANQKICSFNEEEFELDIHDHHIIPLGSATSLGQSAQELRKKKDHLLNSPLNRTYISKKANDLISSKSPKHYLGYMSQLSIWGHAIPSPLSSLNFNPGEAIDEYYDRVLTKRYEEIKKMLLQELATLTSI